MPRWTRHGALRWTCARELGTVVVGDSAEFGYTQAERMTRLLQFCQSAFFADYVLLLDADEFLGAPDEGEYRVRDLSQPLELGRAFRPGRRRGGGGASGRRHAEILLDSITRHARRTIIFSAAEPGQPGHGHVNCQPIAHWLERLAARGWYPDLVDSLGIRALATMSWFRRNFVVLRRDDPQAGADAIATLMAIGAKPFTWYGQAPGIRQRPFSEPLPPPAGYRALSDQAESPGRKVLAKTKA